MINRSYGLSALAAIFVFGGALSGCGGTGADLNTSTPSSPRDAAPARIGSGAPDFVPNQVLVKFAPGVTAESRRGAFAAAEGRQLQHIATKAMERAGDRDGIFLIESRRPVEDAISALKSQPGVLVAEPNYIYQHNATSNDTYYVSGQLWGMYGSATSPANQYGTGAGTAWANNHTGSSSVYVAIIDEGVMHGHTDLAGQVWTNPFDPVDGVDNDGNGYVDDTRGWDFDGNNNTTFDGGADDHGTHVAGTIGAKGGNGLGVAGVVWNTTIISCKFLGSRGGTTANAILAFDYVTDLKTRHGLDIVASNNSWGGGGFSQLLKDAIDRHGAADILAMCAAGNNGTNNDSSPHYPSSYASSNIIAVASINSNGAKSSFSNYGATSVDIGAPGNGIISTVPSKSGSGSNYASYGGTSMATPHVTGAAALLAATSGSRGLTLRSAILNAGTPTASMNGTTVTGDRLNASGF